MLVSSPDMDRKRTLQYAKFSRVYAEHARLQDASLLQSKVREHLENTLGMDDTRTQDTTQALSATLTFSSRHREALTLSQAAFDSCMRTLGPNHFRTLKFMGSLGKCESAIGHYKQALKLHETAIEGLKTYLPSNDPAVGMKDHPAFAEYYRALANLAVINEQYFRYQKAQEILTTAVEGLTRTLGQTDEDTLGAKETLATVSLDVGGDSVQRAYAIMLEVKSQRAEKYGLENGFTLWSTIQLARIKTALGRGLEAEQDMRRTIGIAIKYYGANMFAVLAGRAHLANTLTQLGKYSEAEAIFNDILDLSLYKHGVREEGDHPDRLMAVWFAVNCYEKQGKFEVAIKRCDEIAKALESFGGSQHPLAVRARERKVKLEEKLSAENMTAEERTVQLESSEDRSVMEGTVEGRSSEANIMGRNTHDQEDITKKGIGKSSTY